MEVHGLGESDSLGIRDLLDNDLYDAPRKNEIFVDARNTVPVLFVCDDFISFERI